MDALNADRLIQGDGTPELVWQRWVGSHGVRYRSLHQWIPAASRLVVVAPHPDDELLACGALLSMHAERGGEALIVAVTDGEASHRGTPDWDAAGLGAARRAESAEGLNRLGLREASVIRVGLPDGEVARHSRHLVKRLKSALKPGDVVISTWRQDGHPDHEASGSAAALACAAVACTLVEAPVWMWHWAKPGDARVPWHRMRGLQLTPQALRRKQFALAAHVSQATRRSAVQGPVLDEAILSRAVRDTEYYLV